MDKIFTFFKKHGNTIALWGTFLSVLIGLYALMQTNEHKKWQNYNEMNLRYYKLYSDMPDKIAVDSGKEFSMLNHEERRWESL